ncbi:MAG: YHS domain-containing protein [Deltaproteobacteria bacterium]|nr:MAG: YHS domain-containing protein [Deltaproteobacteria bacterium]
MKSLISVLVLALFLAAPLLAAHASKQQTTCPVLGGNVNKDVFVDYKGQRIYFCCPGCDAEFKKDPEKYLQKMKEQGVQPEKAPTAK